MTEATKEAGSFAANPRSEWEPLSPACQPCREPGGTCFPGLCKLYWRWLHKDGHLRARIVSETAGEVDIEYRHVTDPNWAGGTRLSKTEFCSTYGMEAMR